MDPRVGSIFQRLDSRLSDADLEMLTSRTTAIVSAPRSGSTLLFALIARAAAVHTIGGESHPIYRQFPHLAAENASFDSGSLDERHADPATVRAFRLLLLALLRDREGQLVHAAMDPTDPPVIIEKTPRNALNLPFLLRIIPTIRFIHLTRGAADTIASLAEAWETGARTGQFVTFRRLPDWSRGDWCFLLPPGWRALDGAPVEQIAAFQWRKANEAILAGLKSLPPDRAMAVDYAQLITQPEHALSRAAKFMGIEADPALQLGQGELPLSASTVSAPVAGKWRARASAIEPLLPELAALEATLAERTGG